MEDNNFQYWKNYWRNPNNINNEHLQKNIGRTKNGRIIDNQIWEKTIGYIRKLLNINTETELLELCCGNGQVIGELATYCKKTVGVDYSEILLKQLKNKYGNQILTLYSDVLNVDFNVKSFDCIIIYFSIQHFSENQTIRIIEKSVDWLKEKGKIFIGDIPNELCKWQYINKPSYKHDYISRVINGEPKIGYWYQPDFFEAIGYYFNNINIKVLQQPSYQINSSYRFDILIEKT